MRPRMRYVINHPPPQTYLAILFVDVGQWKEWENRVVFGDELKWNDKALEKLMIRHGRHLHLSHVLDAAMQLHQNISKIGAFFARA